MASAPLAVLTPAILQLPIELKQGADATILLTVVDANNLPITDPTGYSVRAQIRATPDGPILFEWNTTPAAGTGAVTIMYSPLLDTSTVALAVTGQQSGVFTWRSAQWDCVLTDPDGKTACLAEGTVAIDPAITH